LRRWPGGSTGLLRRLGLGRGSIDRRVQAGELHVWHRGVYDRARHRKLLTAR
jgi:hypothetical protein